MRDPESLDRTCSPRPRGWSRQCEDAEITATLLPAPAGDGPDLFERGIAVKVCSPRPRGWSLAGQGGMDYAALLPARGDGPAKWCGARAGSSCFPRPRDGPGTVKKF